MFENQQAPAPDEDEARGEATEEAGLEERLEEAEREKAQFRALAQRAQADLVNYKSRASEELKETIQSANARILLKILNAVDDFERAMKMVPGDAVAPGWLEGLELVRKSLTNVLEAEGVTRVDVAGKPFDPFLSEAVHYLESEEADEGQVIEVLRAGYKHRDRVLRAAQVVVAKKPEQEDNSQEEE